MTRCNLRVKVVYVIIHDWCVVGLTYLFRLKKGDDVHESLSELRTMGELWDWRRTIWHVNTDVHCRQVIGHMPMWFTFI